MELRGGKLDHPIYFSSRKLSKIEDNYTTMKRERLAMVYSFQEFKHYFLRDHFDFFIDYSILKYLVNKQFGRLAFVDEFYYSRILILT
jgi:hypothetical protein